MTLLIVVEKTEGADLLNISNFPWSECSITENRNIYISDSLNFNRHKRDLGSHRYEFELVTVEMYTSDGRGIMAKLSAAADDLIIFEHPRLSFTQGIEPVEGIKSSGVHSVGEKEVDLSSIGTWQLKAGDYISFGSHNKVYQVAEDTNLTTGIQTVKLTFPLVKEISDQTTVIANNVEWVLSSDGVIEAGMVASDGQTIQITLNAVEKL